MHILLIQARLADDPMLAHERMCFARQTGLPESAFQPLNMVTEPLDPALLSGVDVVMIGGSGDFSVVQGGFDWHSPMLDFMRLLVARRFPTFASCFGHQALAQALGGEVACDAESGELGSFEIHLTDAGRADPLFGALPDRFHAQLGHNDSVVAVPAAMTVLARSERCAVQALRVDGCPIVTTQFHPELDRDANLDRYRRYIHAYKPDCASIDESIAEAEAQVRPSPEANGLLRAFLAMYG